MKFELNESSKQITDSEIVNDLKSVAIKLGKSSLKIRDYSIGNGALYSYQTAKKRFGNWKNALNKAGLSTENSVHGVEYGESSLQTKILINDILRVAHELNNSKITLADYEKHGLYSGATITKRFGGWNKAKQEANLEIGRVYNTSVEEFMQNILDLWTHYGRQPKYAEVVSPVSKYSVSSYERKFGSWRSALEKFIEYTNETNINDNNVPKETLPKQTEIADAVSESVDKKIRIKTKRTPRTINLRLRWLVLKRDNFSCKKCGRSPAKDPSIELHVDHIIPWSKDGETVIENLETLCTDCNLGKSNVL